MGYAVYAQGNRWAGYGVPAECDHPDCAARIDRGMDYRCDELYNENEETGEVSESEGCMMFFCPEHQDDEHDCGNVVGKPDSAEWMAHMLADDSWADWRSENAASVKAMQEQLVQ